MRRFDDESKKVRRGKSQEIKIRIQKINLVRSIKEIVADLMRSEIEQIERILLKVIEVLEVNLKADIENSSKLALTLNRIENRLQIIEKQNANQSTRAKTYASVVKAVTKIIRNEIEDENIINKTTTANMMTTRKEKKLTLRIENGVGKTGLRQISDVKLLKRIKRATEESKSETMRLRWLLSGDLMLFLASSAVKKELEEGKQGIKAIGESVKILKRSYGVMIILIQVSPRTSPPPLSQ